MAAHKIAPVHPGEMLLEEFMKPLGLSSSELARRLDVPANRVTKLVQGKRAMTADPALRLEAYLGWTAATWLRIQAEYDLEISRRRVRRKPIVPHVQLPARGGDSGKRVARRLA